MCLNNKQKKLSSESIEAGRIKKNHLRYCIINIIITNIYI